LYSCSEHCFLTVSQDSNEPTEHVHHQVTHMLCYAWIVYHVTFRQTATLDFECNGDLLTTTVMGKDGHPA
jgi:hypothetical protein